jgi:micrococcal nuclease
MEGIDAPEKGITFCNASNVYLGNLCFNHNIKLEITGCDNKRIISFKYLNDGKELSLEMIKAGHAWHAKKFSTDKNLAELEIEARNARKGLWSKDNSMSPLKNKQLHEQGISTKDSFDIDVHE